jgi:GTPase SAR1 family protein
MATYNSKTKEIDCKIVYYGPALSGKTTNLLRLHEAFPKYVTADMVSIETKGDRTLFLTSCPWGWGK